MRLSRTEVWRLKHNAAQDFLHFQFPSNWDSHPQFRDVYIAYRITMLTDCYDDEDE